MSTLATLRTASDVPATGSSLLATLTKLFGVRTGAPKPAQSDDAWIYGVRAL